MNANVPQISEYENLKGLCSKCLELPLISKDNVVSKFAKEKIHTKIETRIRPIEGMERACFRPFRSKTLWPAVSLDSVSDSGSFLLAKSKAENDKMAAIYTDGDVFILGHNHQLYAKPIDSLKIEDGEERLRRSWYCRGGSFLKYAEYARYGFFGVARTGWVTMEFSEDGIKAWEN